MLSVMCLSVFWGCFFTAPLPQLMEILLIERAFAGLVVQQGVGSVDGVVGAEEHFFAAIAANGFDCRRDRHPRGVAVEVGQRAEQVERRLAVGADAAVGVEHRLVSF